MTSDNEIAQALVKMGIIDKDSMRPGMYSLKSTDGQFVGVRYEADEIVRDWRVAGAVMERVIEWGGWDRICSNTTEDFLATCYRGYANKRHIHNVVNESLPRAINEAGVQALETEK